MPGSTLRAYAVAALAGNVSCLSLKACRIITTIFSTQQSVLRENPL